MASQLPFFSSCIKYIAISGDLSWELIIFLQDIFFACVGCRMASIWGSFETSPKERELMKNFQTKNSCSLNRILYQADVIVDPFPVLFYDVPTGNQ